jgi:GT2 family glycosyltransferase
MATSPSVSVVITNYNTNPLTLRCIEAVRRVCPGTTEIVVVDDASSESPRGVLPADVRLVENAVNQGYVRSVNIGVKEATGDLVLLLDSDAAPITDVVTTTAATFAADSRLGALGFRLVDRNGAPTGATQPEPTALGLALGQALEERFVAGRARPDAWFTIHSCALAFRRQVFIDMGGLDEGFDFLDADSDFSMRLWRAGWNLKVNHEARILHEGSGSPQTTARRVIRFHANRWHLLEKHGRISHPRLLKGILALRHTAELLWLIGPARFTPGGTPEWRSDRLASRRQLLASVWRSYHPPARTGPER